MNNVYATCLLIDDSYIDNYVNRKTLEYSQLFHHIFVSQDPNDAIKSLRDGRCRPDVIFLDLHMPSMDGFQFLDAYDKIEIDKDHIKLFILSSSIDPQLIKRSAENKYVTKFIHKALTPSLINKLLLDIPEPLTSSFRECDRLTRQNFDQANY